MNSSRSFFVISWHQYNLPIINSVPIIAGKKLQTLQKHKTKESVKVKNFLCKKEINFQPV